MGWDTFGGALQLIGVLVVGFGVMELRDELDPQHGPIAWAKHQKPKWKRWVTSLRGQLRRALRAIRRWARNVWHRLRGKQPVNLVSVRGVSATLSVSASATGTVTHPPDWDTLTSDERIETLRERTERHSQRMARIEERQRTDREELEQARRRLEDLHLGGLSREAWGLQLIAAGIFIAVWHEWVADTVLVQALLLGWSLLAMGLWATSTHRRWWTTNGAANP